MTIPRCLTCKHCEIDSGFHGSDVTPADPGQWICRKNRWPDQDAATGVYEDMKPIVIRYFEAGETCDVWEPDKRTARAQRSGQL